MKDIFSLLNFNKNKDNEFNKKLLLYVVGAQKSGTTWLWNYLKGHKQVFVSEQKELQYFNCKYYPEIFKSINDGYNKHLELQLQNPHHKKKYKMSSAYRNGFDTLKYRKKSFRNEAYYLKYFKKHVSNEKCFVDVTPPYSALDADIYKKMIKLHPETKFIFIMRNPLDRFCSGIKHSYKITDINDELIDNCINDINFKVRSNYKSTIENLEKAMGKEKLLYLFYEDLFCDETIKEICNFLGIEFKNGDYQIRYRQTYEFDFSQNMLKQIFNSQKDVYEFIFEKFGEKTPSNWRNTYDFWSKNCLI